MENRVLATDDYLAYESLRVQGLELKSDAYDLEMKRQAFEKELNDALNGLKKRSEDLEISRQSLYKIFADKYELPEGINFEITKNPPYEFREVS